jgi:hypothetical protein
VGFESAAEDALLIEVAASRGDLAGLRPRCWKLQFELATLREAVSRARATEKGQG